MDIQLPLVLFTLFAGAGGGTMVFLCLAELFGIDRKICRVSCYVTAVLFCAGGLCSLLHLEQKANVMAAVMNVGSFSGISLELIGLTVSLALIVVYWFLSRGAGAERGCRIVAVLCGIAGLVFCWIQGSSYVIDARPLWATALLPLGYWASGIAVGGGVFVSVMVVLKADGAAVRRMSLWALATCVVQIACYGIYAYSVGIDALAANALLFWGVEIIVGCIVPLVCWGLVYVGKSASIAYVALAALVVGAVAFRVLMWMLGEGSLPNLFEIAATSRGWIG